MHSLYFYFWAWIVLIVGIILPVMLEVALKKTGNWESWITSRWLWLYFLILPLTATAFIVLGSHGLIMWCAMELTISRCTVALAIGMASLAAGIGLWILLSIVIPDNVFGVDSEMGRNLP